MFDAATATTNHIMGHQGEYTEPDILDLSSENCQGFEFNSSTWLSSTLDSQKEKTENRKREWHDKCNIVPISAEELKIRSELGMEIENDLEKEIKEGIYQLALRLHRIYQERKERSAKETFEVDNNRGIAVSEVNISIRMEGRSKVEIREVKNEEKDGPFLRNFRPQNVKQVKKVDWVKTLRGGSSPVCGSRLSSVSSKHKGKKLSTDPNGLSNWKIHGGRGKKVGSFGLVKQNASVDKKILQLGWKV
ncbi:hypothetical protein PHAVU_002G148800 [Phaseolus vulgaris]|uniref:Uncharacterized protein n=1 Tax=Phaseolus vulgaris TaxID=3885 RepID=V7CJS4_PHAVU|nr:hypothetical protein PHAVU_002G148800g [Phaseolus vulgaris]ESW30379.1 hypothetical protein PHAVU_002G148800g [Phaseolus vulgaris]